VLVPSLLLLPFAAHADAVDDYIKGEMARMKIPGLTLGIVKDGKLIRTEAYGLSDIEHDVPATKDDIFEIGSVTKQFTAVAVMMLVEDGKVSLDDPVTKYLDDVPKSWEKVTLRHMLYQTSGFPDYALVPGLGIVEDFNRAKFVKTMGEMPFDFEPGTTWAYSNTNYALLGWVIEKAAGKDYMAFVQERIIQPLGMTKTSFSNPYVVVKRRSHGYLLNQGNVLRMPAMAASVNSDGTIMSNIEDMAKWDTALRTGKLLKPESYRLLWAPASLKSGRTRAYGMGFFLSPPQFPKFIGHHGNSAGYGASHSHWPEKNLSVIVLCNIYPAPGNVIAQGVAETLEPSLKFKPDTTAASADPDTKRTEKVSQALAKLATNTADPELMEPELTAPMTTGRMKMGPGQYGMFRKIDKIDFVAANKQGKDTWLTYRVATAPRNFTVYVLMSEAGKVAQILPRAEPK